MKIFLVNPPRSPHNNILKFAPEAAKQFIHKKLIGPPLGLLTVASAVSDFDVFFLEMKAEYDLNPDSVLPDRMMRAHLERIDPDIVASTFIASEYDLGMDLFRAAKQYNPNILTVAGGLHTTLCPEDFFNNLVDVICPGQSAHTFRQVAIAHKNKSPLKAVPGIFFGKNGRFEYTGAIKPEVDGAGKDFLIPDRSYIKKWLQIYKVGKSPDPATYVFTSLGCPYKCTFCSIWPQYKGRYYQRNVQSVIDELSLLNDYPVVRFSDANTVVNEHFIEELFEQIEKEGIRKFFIMDFRVDTAAKHPKLIEKLSKGGLKVVICGFESFRNEELKRYNKTISERQIKEAISIFHQNGIMIRGNYVVPPDYTKDDFAALADYAGSYKVAYAGYTILSPMPGTEFFNKVKKHIVDKDLAKYNFFNSVLKTTLPYEEFHYNVGKLWTIKKGKDVI